MTRDEAVAVLRLVARFEPEGSSWNQADALLSVDYDVRSEADMVALVEALFDLPEAARMLLGGRVR